MSVITAYVRLPPQAVARLRGNSNWLETIDSGDVQDAVTTDVDKGGDGLTWLLRQVGQKTELAALLSGEAGKEEPELPSPYGDPARLLSQEEVRALSTWLMQLDVAALRTAYDPNAMARAGIYPHIWVQQGQAAFEEYLLPHFARLRSFLAEAAAASQCVLVYFT